MLLRDASYFSLEESRLYIDSLPILEDGEGPRWKFRYDNYDVDPTPDILLLGAYRHPNTGNDLIGGINIRYLSKSQFVKLSRVLPNIMKGSSLYSRYWIGRRLAPEIFNNYYRTYDSKYVRGVEQDIMYPKYGVVKAIQNWAKQNISNIFKSKREKEKEAEPDYPEDIKNVKNQLDQVVRDLQQVKIDKPIDSPEIRKAKEQNTKREKEAAQRNAGITNIDDKIVAQELDDYIDKEKKIIPKDTKFTDSAISISREPKFPGEVPEVSSEIPEIPEVSSEIPEVPEVDKTPEQRREVIDKEREEIQDDLRTLEDSIVYYSPVQKRYIIEYI